MYKVVRSFVCEGCVDPVTGAGCMGVDVGVNAEPELVDGFCCLGDMLGVDWMGMLVWLLGPEFWLGGVGSGSCFHCLPMKLCY